MIDVLVLGGRTVPPTPFFSHTKKNPMKNNGKKRTSFKGLKRNGIIAVYRERERLLKEQYKKERGYKAAIGFTKTDEYRKNKRNKSEALRRYDLKNPRRTKKIIRGFSNLSVLSESDSHHTALSFGGGADRAAMASFDIMETGGDKFEVIFRLSPELEKETGIKSFAAGTRYEFSQGMRKLYSAFNKLQEQGVIGSKGISVDAIEGSYNSESFLKIDMDFSE